MITRPLHGAALYHVLSHLDLGADAASTYDPRTAHADAPWRPALLEAWRHASPDARVMAQFLAHWTPDIDALLVSLEGRRWRWAADERGAALADALLVALLIELPTLEATHDHTSDAHERFVEAGLPAVERCRAALWAGRAPPLRIMDCDALGPHGRGARDGLGPGRAVALSLSQPLGHAVCQLLHEEIHPVTDGPIYAAHGGDHARSTARGEAGFELHRALEEAAVEAGFGLIDTHAPAFSDAYRRWCARFGLSADAGAP